MLDVEILSRLQFAFTIIFHYIFPPFSIGTGLCLVVMEGMYLKTKNPAYEQMAKFWTKIFAANFSIGVASGIVMEFEFGTNWATYSRFVGDIFGSPLAAEGIFAFFLESGFLAVLLFGWNRVSSRMHFLATCMVFLGSMMSGFWIVVANSWMQTPAGFEVVGEGVAAKAVITDFWAMIFNPSTVIRFSHTICGAFIQGSFLVLSVSSYYLLKGRHLPIAKRSLNISLTVAFLSSVLMFFLGHEQAKEVAIYQPEKLAAYEGHYETGKNVPLYLFGWTDVEEQKTYGIAIPGMLSYLIGHSTDTEVKGLNDYPREDWAPAGFVFQTYHLMVGIGMFLIALTALGMFFRVRNKLADKPWMLKIFIASVILPVLANQLGWISAEVGRQPWIVYHLLRTSEAVSKTVKAEEVLASIIMFLFIYVALFFTWLFVLNKEIKHGPEDQEHEDDFGAGYLRKKEEFSQLGLDKKDKPQE